METLSGFVDTVWSRDMSLITPSRVDPRTGKPRQENAAWSKPDERNRSFELRLITTESRGSGHSQRRFDFFEYYWAHQVTGTSFEMVKDWLFGLMWRNPFTNVPRGLIPAWLLMWVITLGFVAISILAGMAISDTPIDPQMTGIAAIDWIFRLAAGVQSWPGWMTAFVWAVLSGIGAFIIKVMISHVGDVARYVRAQPRNIAIRQAIRENGVRLLEELMGVGEDGSAGKSRYDRIIVVGHSLGTIVGYDILTHAFGRHNDRIDPEKLKGFRQPRRAQMEEMIRSARAGGNFDLDEFRKLQALCRRELNALGNPWIVSDFVTMGSPLTHAEFLMEKDRAAVSKAKDKRVLPACPPVMEYDGTTKKLHFTYRTGKVKGEGVTHDLEAPRVPHHAALFAFTRWTNIFSPLRGVVGGDIVSGPVADIFGLDAGETEKPVSGIRDIAVLPTAGGTPQDRKKRWFTHLLYWNMDAAKTGDAAHVPAHIQALRDALALKEN
ncbi:hypothetical protein GCM10009127_13690 [Alteraurantiacibacter aestuarii]